MGLFDFFKKKPASTETGDNALEILLKSAATNPASRPEFYRKLLTEKLFILTDKTGLGEGVHVLKKNSSVNIVSFSEGKIPVFTSLKRIFDKGVINKQVNYLQVKGEDLFGFTKGATLLLNPYSDYGKELLPDEIQRLLSGTIFQSMSQKLTIEKDTKVQIGQPAIYPTEMINALIPVFKNDPSVNAVYLGFIQYPEKNESPHYIFGIDATGDTNAINEKTGSTAQQFLKSGEYIDLIKIDEGALDKYFSTIEPFYKK